MSDLGRQEEKGPSDATMKKIQCGQDLSVPFAGEPDRSGQEQRFLRGQGTSFET